MDGLRLPWLVLCILPLATTRRLSSEFYDKLVIPDDKTLTVFLQPAQVVKLFYLLQKDVQALTLAVSPCTTAVSWELEYRNTNQTGKVEVESGRGSEAPPQPAESEQRSRTVSPASSGLYTLRLSGTDRGWVEVYATFLGQPEQLWPRGRLLARSRPVKGHVFLRWSRTSVDPELTEYVLVVHPESEQVRTLCQAVHNSQSNHIIVSSQQEDNVELITQTLLHVYCIKDTEEAILSHNLDIRLYTLQWLPNSDEDKEVVMEKTGQRTSWLLEGIGTEQPYRAQVFALNMATNFSYKYAELENLVYSRPKPRPLVDGVTVTTDLKPHEPAIIYRYKVRKDNLTKLEIGVTACGEDTVRAEVRKRGSGPETERSVRGHAVLTVARPQLGAVYLVKLKLPPGARTLTAQLVVKGDGLEEPRLPEPAEVHEFRGLRACEEVTLGWVPVEGQATYCLRASLSPRGHILTREPDQCAVEQQLNSLGYSVLQCSDIVSTDRKVVSERLSNLKPGKQYDIQLSVKKGNSRRLSYKLVRVRTKSRCS